MIWGTPNMFSTSNNLSSVNYNINLQLISYHKLPQVRANYFTASEYSEVSNIILLWELFYSLPALQAYHKNASSLTGWEWPRGVGRGVGDRAGHSSGTDCMTRSCRHIMLLCHLIEVSEISAMNCEHGMSLVQKRIGNIKPLPWCPTLTVWLKHNKSATHCRNSKQNI